MFPGIPHYMLLGLVNIGFFKKIGHLRLGQTCTDLNDVLVFLIINVLIHSERVSHCVSRLKTSRLFFEITHIA